MNDEENGHRTSFEETQYEATNNEGLIILDESLQTDTRNQFREAQGDGVENVARIHTWPNMTVPQAKAMNPNQFAAPTRRNTRFEGS
jgi:hypothetical protein